MSRAPLPANLISLLRSPQARAPLIRKADRLTCPVSDFEGRIIEDVVVMLPANQRSFFDDKFEVMRQGHKAEGEHHFCYEQQMQLFESYLQPDMVVLDIGCGPSLPYQKPAGVQIIGLEPSFNSISANDECDLRIQGSAYAIPLADHSVDLVVCIYSVHHMVGESQAETLDNVQRAFVEFGRVLKPGGSLFIFEMTPLSLFAMIQRLGWNLARRLFPHFLDMYFWSAANIVELGQLTLPVASQVEKIFFGTSAFIWFPPIFSLPWLRVPRLVYPLDAKLYIWHLLGPQANRLKEPR